MDLNLYGLFTDPEFHSFTHTLYKVSQRISCLQLQHLNINLRCRLSNTSFCILSPLMILRNARVVTFKPEPQNPLLQHRKRNSRSLAESQPQFADYLKRQLESSQPRVFLRSHLQYIIHTQLLPGFTPQELTFTPPF